MICYKCDMCLSDHYEIGEMNIVTIKYAGIAHVNFPRGGVFHVCDTCTGKMLNSLHAFTTERSEEEKPLYKWRPLSLKTLNGDDIVAYESSCCKAIADKKYQCCPNCGVKMDGGEKYGINKC